MPGSTDCWHAILCTPKGQQGKGKMLHAKGNVWTLKKPAVKEFFNKEMETMDKGSSAEGNMKREMRNLKNRTTECN